MRSGLANCTPMNTALHTPVFFQGLTLSLGLIMAIGAQNAFVLRQGLRQEHIGPIVLFCAGMDSLLIMSGVFGMAATLAQHPGLAQAMAWVGAAFLAWYGAQALRRVAQPQHLRLAGASPGIGLGAALSQAAAFTLLNPHVYLDTVLLVGSVGAQQPSGLQPWFVAGASTASIAWFCLLGFGSRWLAPLFAKPKSWQVLDGVIGVSMFGLSLMMVQWGLRG